MKQNDMESGIETLERAKTAKPYTKEELRVLDDGKDLARILATMAEYEKVWETRDKKIWKEKHKKKD